MLKKRLRNVDEYALSSNPLSRSVWTPKLIQNPNTPSLAEESMLKSTLLSPGGPRSPASLGVLPEPLPPVRRCSKLPLRFGTPSVGAGF